MIRGLSPIGKAQRESNEAAITFVNMKLQTYRPRTCAQLLLCAVLVGLLIDAGIGRPFPQREGSEAAKGRKRRDMPRDNFNPNNLFPTNIPTVTYPTPEIETCFENVVQTYLDVEITEIEGQIVIRNVTRTRTVRQCCEGWEGDDCERRNDTYPRINPADPCSDLQCVGYPEAQCAVVNKCGMNLPVFFDINTRSIAKCRNGQPVDLNVLTCRGICSGNPCEELTCSAHPDAVCFVRRCDCSAIWILLPDGAQVDCSTGDRISPERSRAKREAGQCS